MDGFAHRNRSILRIGRTDCPRLVRLLAILLPACTLSPALHAADDSTLRDLKRLNVEQLLAIEVTSTARRPEKLLDAAAAIRVISRTEILRSGATTLSEALRLAGSLQWAQRGTRGAAISSRGFNTELANKLLVMIDGRTVYTPLFSGVFWEAQDYLLEDIERIEVINGPGGALWGANAVNGVINVITRDAADSHGLHVEAGAGGELVRMAGIRYGSSISPDIDMRVFGKHFARGDSALADGSDATDGWHRTQGGFRIDAANHPRRKLTLHGDLYSLHAATPDDNGTRMRGANVLGRWTQQLAGGSEAVLQTYLDWTLLSMPVAPLVIGGTQFAPAGRLRDDLKTFDLDFQHRLDIGQRQQLVWGIGFRHTHNVIDNAPALAVVPAKLDQQLYSAFVQDEIRLRDNLSVFAGTKLEHNDYTGFEFEPSVRLQWQLTGERTAWAAVSRAIRAPSRIDRDMLQGPPPGVTVLRGDSAFRSENLLAYELGFRAQIGQRAGVSISVFHNEYTDLRSTTITPVTLLPFYFENNLAGHSRGGEFSGSLQVTEAWSLRLDYNLLKTKLKVREGAIDISNGLNETADPDHQVALRSSWDLPGNIELDAGLRWVDSLRNNNGPDSGRVPDYVELDLHIGWHFGPGLELSVAGQNLLHARHPEYGFPTPTRAEAERSVHGKLVWRR